MTSKFPKNRPLTEGEEAQIQAMIANDTDAPEATDEEIAAAKPFSEMFPELTESIKRSRGRPRVEDPKQAITLRLSAKTVERFKALGGDNWRGLMAETLERT